jgi:soluble lytic murein transglycosylase
MQIIPGTASKIARQLGEQGFQQEQLYNPSLNLRYGSFYFAQLMKHFEGKLFLALAAYNAGEKNARRWWQEKETEEWEEFVENIPFAETRHYIRQVISNYNNYLLLYGPSG